MQVIQFINDPLDISSVKFPYIHRLRIPVPVIYMMNLLSNIKVLSRLYIIIRVAVTEAVCINLIHDRSFCPIRCRKARHDFKIIIIHKFALCSPFVIVADLIS